MAKRPGMSDFFFKLAEDFMRPAASRRCNRGAFRACCHEGTRYADGAIRRVASDRFVQIFNINELVGLSAQLVGDYGLGVCSVDTMLTRLPRYWSAIVSGRKSPSPKKRMM